MSTGTSGLPAVQAHAQLRQAFARIQSAEESAVQCFARIMRRQLHRDLGYSSELDHLDASAVVIGYTSETGLDVSAAPASYYHVTTTGFAGNESGESTISGGTAVDGQDDIPARFALSAKVPNPFNPTTLIRFDLPAACKVRLVVYEVTGRQVCCLVEGEMPAGIHRVRWQGSDDQDRPGSSGVYLYRIEAGDFRDAKRMVLVR